MVNECTVLFNGYPPHDREDTPDCFESPFRTHYRAFCWDDPEPVSSWRAQAYIRAAATLCDTHWRATLGRVLVGPQCWQLKSGYWLQSESDFTSCRSQRLN